MTAIGRTFAPIWQGHGAWAVSLVLSVHRAQGCNLIHVIPEIDISRAASLMLKRYGENTLEVE
jgi:hypothetical protein